MFEFKMDINKTAPVVGVRTTDGRGFTPEELAEQCVKRIVGISETAHPALRDQANAFSDHIEKLVTHYLKQAVHSDRTTVYNALLEAGHPKLAEHIRRL